ncbi:hypothetical protein pEaSNUABM52_00285 [Erwinia phage pEp_SNUABM_52]|nr:hypothetical protein pEaSNUABM52_00285 [Erwinia phage pEp_SNUABM_52]
MIKQLPNIVKGMNCDDAADYVGLHEYSATVKGTWRLIHGLSASGERVVVLSVPQDHHVLPDYKGVQTLIHYGFKEVDALLALCIHRNEYAQMKKKDRAAKRKAAEVKQQPRRSGPVSLDDL